MCSKWGHLTPLHSQTVFPGGSVVKSLPAMQETRVWSLGWEGPLEKAMATHSNILAWRIPWMEKPGGIQSMHKQSDMTEQLTHTHTHTHTHTSQAPCLLPSKEMAPTFIRHSNQITRGHPWPAFSCIHAKLLQLCLSEAPWTVACQAPLSMGFSRQEYWSGLPCLPPGDLPDPGIEPSSLTPPAGSLPWGSPGKPLLSLRHKEKSQISGSHHPSLLLPPSNPWLPFSLVVLSPLLPLTIQPSLSRHSWLFKTWIRSHSLAQKSPCSFLSYFEEIQTSHKASAQLSSSLPLLLLE